ncbi:transcription factor kayak isoform X1 [Photinus pyralis]|uniref:transcription factor kayak isoform X1 n=1 Tax=Photinus pyralis TaxID=7054 RepID=UPI0012671205|nr:transcription factor kayak isoform X1 [Photinus pyralis]
MKMDYSDGLSTNSDFSSDSQNSQTSSDFLTSSGNGLQINAASFITLEGLNSGVPTRTTPTLTPTTLRNIEQTFIELQSKPESHENEAGFVPPLVHAIGNNQYIPASEIDIYSKSSIWSNSQASTDLDSRPGSPVTPPKSGQQSEHTRRNMGGRKPVKDLNLTPEEEERRRVRRERNKMAAARCRKRRVDHTNALLNETDGLEQKKLAMQNELQELQAIKEELEFLLDSHRTSHCCRLQNGQQNDNPPSPPDIKPFVIPPYHQKVSTERVKTEIIDTSCIEIDADMFPFPAKKVMLSSTALPLVKPSRPSSLNVCSVKSSVSELAGISITTPSSGMQFNFDSLMVGGTGLTPISAPLVPSCSTQQRNIPTTHADISSPDTCGPPKLVSL